MLITADAHREVLARVYEWRHGQATAAASGAFAAATAILTPLLAAVFDATARLESWHIALFGAGAALAALGGALFRKQARQVQCQYLEEALADTFTETTEVLTW